MIRQEVAVRHMPPWGVDPTVGILEELLQESRENSAPSVKLDPDGPELRGRTGMTLGPFETEVGEPLPVSIWVRRDNPFDEDDRQGMSFRWYKYDSGGRTQPGDFEFFCCWTNVMVDVSVTP